MKGTECSTTGAQTHSTSLTTMSRAPARKRPISTSHSTSTPIVTTHIATNDKDSDWLSEISKKKTPIKQEPRDISK